MLYFSVQNASPRWDGGGCEMTISLSSHGRTIPELSEFPVQS